MLTSSNLIVKCIQEMWSHGVERYQVHPCFPFNLISHSSETMHVYEYVLVSTKTVSIWTDLNTSYSKHFKLILSFTLTVHPMVRMEIVSIERDVRTTCWAIIPKQWLPSHSSSLIQLFGAHNSSMFHSWFSYWKSCFTAMIQLLG